MRVELQKPDEGTCVSCATVNALRHFGIEIPVDQVITALTVQRFHGRDGSFVNKAAKWLRREFGMDVVKSQPRHLIRDRVAAAVEVAYRFEALLMQGYVGLIFRKETAREGHAVVLHRITRDHGEPFFVCYDSNKRIAAGHWTYKVQDFIVWCSDEEAAAGPKEEDLHHTGRVGFFVRPGRIPRACLVAGHNPFRSRKAQRTSTATFGATCPPEG